MLTYVPDNERQAIRILGNAQKRHAQHRIANRFGISRQAVSRALLLMDEKIETTLREMAQANQIADRKDQCRAGILIGCSVPFQTAAIIFVSEKHGVQVWYEHDGDCGTCQSTPNASSRSGTMQTNWGQDRKDRRPDKDGGRIVCKSEGAPMTLTRLSETIHEGMGWCPNSPTVRTTPVVLAVPSATAHPAQPGSGANDGGQGRIQRGLSIATGSIRAMFRERHLLWFSLIAGIVILFLIVAEGWSVTHYALIPLPYTIWIPFGNSSLIVFNLQSS